MKLIDLCEDLYNTTKQEVELNRDLKRDPKPKDINSGAFASVADKKSDPFMVRKTSHDNNKTNDISGYDGYWSYINGIIENDELKNNPFLPRVYNIKKIKDASGKVVMRANLEKLQHGNAFELEILIPYFSNLFGGDYEERINTYLDEEGGDRRDTFLEVVATRLHKAIYYDDYSVVQNKYLINALKYIATFEDTFALDIHAGNMMFRMGGHGIQLVITDPLAKIKMIR